MSRIWRLIFVRLWSRIPKWLRFAATAFLALLAIGACWLYYFLYWAPLPESLTNLKPLTTVYLDSKGRLIAEIAGPEARSHRPVSLAEMGPWLPSVIVQMEDRRFYSHRGIDAWGTARALLERRGGGSTITQQLVKIATGRKGRDLLAKAREALLALQLERRWSKQQILEAYLNRIPFGNRLIGAEAASQAYFNKPAALLTKSEAIYLAGLPREPSRLNPWSHPGAAEKRFDGSRQLLAARGFLGAQEAAEMLPPAVEKHLPGNAAPHFIQLASRAAFSASGGGVVRCTLDLDIQRRAEQLIRDNLGILHRPDITQAAMVVIENESGAVRALAGSRDFKQSQVNGAMLFRNSGSTLKPFLYVTGIDSRVFTAATLLPDTAEAARDAYMDYDPHNFVLSHLGPVRVREALGNSLNVPAVVAVSRIGARNAFNAIGDWGVRFDRPLEKAGAGFILGNVGVRLLDLTGAFSALARGGLAGPPQFIEGQTMPLKRVVSADADSIVVDILCDNSARLQSFGPHSSLAFPVRIAAKTGTSAGFHDAWTVGFTREHTVGVWVGNFDGRPMDHIASAAAAAPLWRRMIEDLLQSDHPVPEPELPRVPVCALTGLRPCAASKQIVGELFLPGTEPRTDARDWFADDGHLLLPKEYAGWCDSGDNTLGATVRPEKEDLAILNPRDGAVFKVDASIPMAQQQMEFQANIPDGVTWSMNGVPLAPGPGGHVLWQLREGDWTLEADNGVVRTRSRFSVRRE